MTKNRRNVDEDHRELMRWQREMARQLDKQWREMDKRERKEAHADGSKT